MKADKKFKILRLKSPEAMRALISPGFESLLKRTAKAMKKKSARQK